METMNKQLVRRLLKQENVQMDIKKQIAVFLSFFIVSNIYANDEIVGKWKTIDDKSGVVRAIVQIYKNTDESYAGKILKIYPRLDGSLPDYTETCLKCKGELKNTPIIGMQVLSGFIKNPKKEDEYINGKIVDPVSGETYKSKIKVAKNYRKLNLRGYIGISQLGRTQTWIRVE